MSKQRSKEEEDNRKSKRKPCRGIRSVAPKNWRDRATITVDEYADLMRIGRNTAYEAARRGDVHTIRVGGRILVTVPALRRQLGD